MDKKIQSLLNKWLENNLISESTYESSEADIDIPSAKGRDE